MSGTEEAAAADRNDLSFCPLAIVIRFIVPDGVNERTLDLARIGSARRVRDAEYLRAVIALNHDVSTCVVEDAEGGAKGALARIIEGLGAASPTQGRTAMESSIA